MKKMTKLRYINLGRIGSDFHCGMSDYIRKIPEGQFLVSYSFSKKAILISSSDELSKYLKVENIPDSLDISRIPTLDKRKGTGVVLMSPNDICLEGIFDRKEFTPHQLERIMLAAKVKILRKHGIQAEISLHRREANDLVIKQGNKLLKFSGEIVREVKGRMTLNSMITLNFDKELAQKIFKLGTEKMKQRGSVKKITDVVMGLRELNPDLDYSLSDEVVESFADFCNFEIEKSNFTAEEKKRIQVLSVPFTKKQWKYYGRH